MAGTVADRQLSRGNRSTVQFAQAAHADDEAIRQLLRENPVPGAISLTFEREPKYFQGQNILGEDNTILAFDSGRLICMGRCTTRPGWLNGESKRIGYLGELRLDHAAQGRFNVLKGGYEFFRQIHRRDGADFYFTSIASDNLRARQLLERGVRGLPTYVFLSEFVTTVIPVPRRSPRLARSTLRYEAGTPTHFEELSEFLNRQASRYQLSTAWSTAGLRNLAGNGLPPGHIQLAFDGERLVGCAGLWDQRAFRQIVVRRYARALRVLRPAINLTAGFFGGASLPCVGSIVPHAFIFPLAMESGYEAGLPALIRKMYPIAAHNGVKLLTLGFAANDPRTQIVHREFRGRLYHSRLYQVTWPTGPAAQFSLTGRLTCPEVALL